MSWIIQTIFTMPFVPYKKKKKMFCLKIYILMPIVDYCIDLIYIAQQLYSKLCVCEFKYFGALLFNSWVLYPPNTAIEKRCLL